MTTDQKAILALTGENERLRARLKVAEEGESASAEGWRQEMARTEAALAKAKELREQGNDGDYGEGMYDGIDAVVEALKGKEV